MRSRGSEGSRASSAEGTARYFYEAIESEATMQCEEVRQQFADYVIEALQEPIRSAVAQHLTSCEACSAEADELKMLWTRLGYIPSAEPSSDLRVRFVTMLDAYRHGMDHARSRSWWQNLNSWMVGWWPRQPALQFGIAVAVLVGGVLIGRNVQREQPPTANAEIVELRAELAQTRQMVAL